MEPIEIIREIFLRGASSIQWDRLYTLFETLDVSKDGGDRWLLDYALEHLQSWPLSLRVAPPHWVEAQRSGKAVDAWPLVRTVRCERTSAKELRGIFQLESLQSIERLELYECGLGPKVGIQALCKSSQLKRLTELSIDGGLVSDTGCELLFQSALAKQLTTLEIIPDNDLSARKHRLTRVYLQHLAEATQMEKIRALKLGAPEKLFDDDSLPTLQAVAEAPHLQALEQLMLRGWEADWVDVFFQYHSFAQLKTLDLSHCSVTSDALKRLVSPPIAPNIESLRLSAPGTQGTLEKFSFADLDRVFASESFVALTSFSMEADRDWDATTFLNAPWATRLRHVELIGHLNDKAYQALANHPSLAQLETLALLRNKSHYHYLEMCGVAGYYHMEAAAARAWVTTTARPSLIQLHADMPIALTEEDHKELTSMCQELRKAPPYPAWEQWVEALVEQGSLLQDALPALPADAIPETALQTIKLRWDYAPKKLDALIAGKKLERCGTLILEMDPSTITQEQGVALLSSSKLTNLRELQLDSIASLCKGNKLNAFLNAIATNPHLTNLKTIDWNFLPNFDIPAIQGFLAIKTSPHISPGIKHAMELKEVFRGVFSGSGEAFEVLCACEEFLALEELDLPKLHINDTGIEVLAACPNLIHLKRLRLQRNYIGDAGAKALANSPYVANLEELDLGYNEHIDDEGYQALANSPYLANAIKKKYKRKVKKK